MKNVFTIGYEGTDISRFVETLLAARIEAIADVRAVPISRKKGFSKQKLHKILNENGILYEHFGSLGDPKPGRDAAKSGRIDDFKKIYRNHLQSAEAQNGLLRLRELVVSMSTSLLCFERDPRVCHRSLVAEKLHQWDIASFDLFGDDPARYVRFADSLPRRDPRESRTASEQAIR